MKKMTCRDMGGTCDAEIQGSTADEMMENGKSHVHSAAEAGDASHKELVEKMKTLSDEEFSAWKKDFDAKFEIAQEV